MNAVPDPRPDGDAEFRLIADCAPVAIWVSRLDRSRSFVNRAYAEFLGVDQLAARHFDWRTILHPDDAADVMARSIAGEESGQPFSLQGRYRRADGEWRWLHSVSHPRRDADGTHIGFIGTAHDITEQKEAEQELRDSEARYRTIFEEANDYIITSGLDQRVTSCNPAVLTALGYTFDEVVGRSFEDFVAPGQFAQTTAMLRQKLAEGGTTRHTVDVMTRDGRTLTWEINSRLTLDTHGVPVSLHVIGRDVTEAKRAEAHQNLLIDELNHRVKNTLAIVQGIAQQTLKDDMDVATVRAAFEGRLMALSRAHSLLTIEHWGPVSMARVVHEAIAPHAANNAVFSLNGPDVTLAPKTAVSLALAIHELATNAVKHGALGVATGTVAIQWVVTPDSDGDRLHFRWTERGGPPVVVPDRRGFGTRLIERGLAAELDGSAEIRFDAQGVECVVAGRLPKGGK